MNPNQQIRIPIPSDSYDQVSCDQATITSIKMLMTTFDTTMDSFHESVDKLASRIDALGERAMTIQRRIIENSKLSQQAEFEATSTKAEGEEGKEGDKLSSSQGNIAKVSYPSLYDHATQMKEVTSSFYRTSSAISIAKQKANDAIKSLLMEELNGPNTNNNSIKEEGKVGSSSSQQQQQHNAKPSDEWLDRASAFEERSNSKMAIQIHTVPPLILNDNSVLMMESAIRSNLKLSPDFNNSEDNVHCKYEIKKKRLIEETTYYKNGLEDIENERYSEKKSNNNYDNAVIFDESSMQQQNSTNNHSLTLDYYDDNMSVISDYTRGAATIGHGGGMMYGGGGGESHTIVSSYSTVSHGTSSASRRRRQRKIMALAEATTSPSRRERIMKDSQGVYRHNQQHHKQKRHMASSSSKNSTSLTSSIASSRQQALSGSIPYVCDLVHDSFGVIDGRFDHVYPSDKTVNEMLIDNNGVAKPELKMNALLSSNHQQDKRIDDSKVAKGNKDNSSMNKFRTSAPLNVLSEENENE